MWDDLLGYLEEGGKGLPGGKEFGGIPVDVVCTSQCV